MKFAVHGFGLYGWETDGLIIHGGMRDRGMNKAGQMRCKFSAYDTATRVELAKLVMVVNLPEAEGAPVTIDRLINIQVPKALRRSGKGRSIVDALVEASGGTLVLCDIKKSAMGFWRKMGAEEFKTVGMKQVDAVIKRAPTSVYETDANDAAPIPPAM